MAYAFTVPFDLVKNEALGLSVTVPAAAAVIVLAAVESARSEPDAVKIRGSVIGLMLALLVWVAATGFWSANQLSSIISIGVLAQNMLVAIALGVYCRRVWPILLIATLTSSTYIAVRVITSDTSTGLTNRATYNGADQNTVALTLCVAVALAFSMMGKGPSLRMHAYLVACSGCCIYAVLLTGSRSGVITVLSVGALFAMTRLRPSAGARGKMAIVAMAGVGYWVYVRLDTFSQISSRVTDFSGLSLVGDDSRGAILGTYFKYFDSWWLIGVGSGADIDFIKDQGELPLNAHGLIWKVWIETGFVGLSIWLGLLISVALAGLNSKSTLRASVAFALVPLAIFSLTLGGQTLSIVWLIIGLCLTSAGAPISRGEPSLEEDSLVALGGRP
ncbi:O-antigen ligase family protein [Nocardioides lijunqiniae]|uniref:O-antigen ligase family protein n=1 Tax=Nocardioides lijunqiniae TaxID=2760832 RepID=UPI0018778D91